ncbi:hypothetical protein Tco_1260794, partial [Tanacetum coccineum]
SVAVKLSAPIDISFRRNARGGIEEHLLADLTSLMDSVTLSNSGDRWVCDLVSDGQSYVGFFRFSSPLRSKLCWRECSSYLGGLSGTLGIRSFLKNLLQDVRKFLML